MVRWWSSLLLLWSLALGQTSVEVRFPKLLELFVDGHQVQLTVPIAPGVHHVWIVASEPWRLRVQASCPVVIDDALIAHPLLTGNGWRELLLVLPNGCQGILELDGDTKGVIPN